MRRPATTTSAPRPATGGRRRLFIAGPALAAAPSSATILGLPAVMPLLLDAFAISHGQGGLIVTALWIPHTIRTGGIAEPREQRPRLRHDARFSRRRPMARRVRPGAPLHPVRAGTGPGGAPGPARPQDVARLPLREAVRMVWVGRLPILALPNLCTFGIFMMVAAWLTSYFVRESGLSLTTSLSVSAAVLGAGAMGRFAGGGHLGGIPDRPLVMPALTLSGTALAGLALSPAFPAAPVLAFVALACCSLTYGSIFAMALGRRPPAAAGVAVSGVSFLAGLGGSILPAVMGWFVDSTGSFGPGFGMLSLLTYAAILLLAAFPPGGTTAGARDGGDRV